MNNFVLSYETLHDFTVNIFRTIGCSQEDAKIVADVLMEAELRGIPSHGLMRIADYVAMWESGKINIHPNPKIIYETHTTITIDGDNCFGMIAATYAMKKVIEKAKMYYTAWATVINSNHYGIAGYYSLMAAKEEMIGISMTNANPLVAPTWSVSRMLGTNPIAVAIPTRSYPPFVADFATTPIARGKLALLEKEGKKIDYGFVQDSEGKPSDNPAILKQGGAMVPLGGDYEHGSHKGYCLSALIDIFSSVLGGANFGPFVPPQVAYLQPQKKSVGKGLGHFLGAIRTDAFRPKEEFLNSMDQWIETFKSSKPDHSHSRVLIPGEPEYEKTLYHRKNGITLIHSVVKDLIKISEKYSIPHPF